MSLVLSSPAFGAGDRIPDRYTGMGGDVSPPLRWSGVPEGTRGFVLVVDDPDAAGKPFGHWAVFDIPADWRELPEGFARSPLATRVRFGRNDAGEAGYGGPYPPRGHGVHHYHFKLAAIDVPLLAITPGAGVGAVWRAAASHIRGEAELVALFERT